jgi:hypothetical protein
MTIALVLLVKNPRVLGRQNKRGAQMRSRQAARALINTL